VVVVGVVWQLMDGSTGIVQTAMMADGVSVPASRSTHDNSGFLLPVQTSQQILAIA